MLNNDSKLNLALNYAAKGMAVFPCEVNGKKPITAHGFQDASTDPEVIRQWWTSTPEANIGCSMGEISGIVLLDIDMKNGKDGKAALYDLEDKHGVLPETLKAKTPSGGLHYFFKYREGYKNSTEKLGTGIDTKGNGGYVIAPGSVIDGKEYEIINRVAPADCPEWIISILNPPRQEPKPRPVVNFPANNTSGQVQDALRYINPDCDYLEWVKIGMALHSESGIDGLGLWDSWSSLSAKYKAGECTHKWQTFQSGGKTTIASLFDAAKAGGYKPERKLPPIYSHGDQGNNPDDEFNEQNFEQHEDTAAENKLRNAVRKDTIILPCNTVSFIKCAKQVFAIFKRDKSLFCRGNKIYEVLEDDNGLYLDLIQENAFRSRLERIGDTFVFGQKNEKTVLMPKRPTRDICAALLETIEARECLDRINNIFKNPVIVRTDDRVKVLTKGYHPENGGVFIQAGESIPEVDFSEAARSLEDLLCDFNFVTDADKARMLSAIISPALRFGGLIGGHCPIHAMEADFSQGGKGFGCELVALLYDEVASKIAMKDGGVGSFDETLSTAISWGRPLIQLDNLRGRLDSQFFEMLLTSFGTVGIRIPHKGEVQADPTHFFFMGTSNGLESTPDLANRCCIIRIRKQPQSYQFRKWDGLELLDHVKNNHAYLLGCVFSIIKEWARQGFPEGSEYRHDFRPWGRKLDAILKMAFPRLPSFMDGHRQAQERTSNPALSWLRSVCSIINEGVGVSASGIAELCAEHGIEIPGLRNLTDEKAAAKQSGLLLSRCFKSGESISVDEWLIERSEVRKQRDDFTGYYNVKTYLFGKSKNNEASRSTAVTAVSPITFPENNFFLESNGDLLRSTAEIEKQPQKAGFPIIDGKCNICGFVQEFHQQVQCPDCLRKAAT